ncbi:MAG: DUF4388 domain-containing protein [Candidatus Alcyoniella australis]|nr:DUF4388 domain-containing protein [Candidatus Alcyoniella australis]
MTNDEFKPDSRVVDERSLITVESQPEPTIPQAQDPLQTSVGIRTQLHGRAELDDIFRMFNVIHREERTGVLRLRCGDRGRDLYLVQGRLVDVRSDPFDPSECLGRVLQRAGFVEQKDVINSLKKASGSKLRQGEALITLGLLNKELLNRTLKAQIETKLYPLFEWNRIDFEFQDRERLPGGLAMSNVKLPWLIMQLAWKRYPMKELRKRFEPISSKYIGRAEKRLYKSSDYGFGTGMQKFWDEILNRDQEWQRLLIISNLKESQTYSAVWALLLTGSLIVLDKPRQDTDAIRMEKLREHLKDIEKFNRFERLRIHWSADSQMVEKAWAKLKPQREQNAKTTEGIEQHLHKQIYKLSKQAYQTLRDTEKRKEYRTKVFDEFFLEVNSDIFRQKGEGLLFTKSEYDKAIEELHSAIEVFDSEGEYYATLGLAIFLKHQRRDSEKMKHGRDLIKKGIIMRPRSESSYICLGLMYKAGGKKGQALEALNKALEFNPKSLFAKSEIRTIETGESDEDRNKALAEFLDRRSDRDKEWDERVDTLGKKKKN